VVPRVKPRLEQWIRAERLHALGLIDVLHPDHVSPETLGSWFAGNWKPRVRARHTINLDGLSRLSMLVEQLLSMPARCGPDLPAFASLDPFMADPFCGRREATNAGQTPALEMMQ